MISKRWLQEQIKMLKLEIGRLEAEHKRLLDHLGIREWPPDFIRDWTGEKKEFISIEEWNRQNHEMWKEENNEYVVEVDMSEEKGG